MSLQNIHQIARLSIKIFLGAHQALSPDPSPALSQLFPRFGHQFCAPCGLDSGFSLGSWTPHFQNHGSAPISIILPNFDRSIAFIYCEFVKVFIFHSSTTVVTAATYSATSVQTLRCLYRRVRNQSAFVTAAVPSFCSVTRRTSGRGRSETMNRHVVISRTMLTTSWRCQRLHHCESSEQICYMTILCKGQHFIST